MNRVFKDLAIWAVLIGPAIVFWLTFVFKTFDLDRPAPCYDHHSQLCAPSEECRRHGY